MTGQDLLYGFSFVDERFIAEAETAVLGRKVPWMKVLSVAACLCILIAGAFALENIGYKGAKEEAAPAAAAPEAMQESATEAAPTMTEACVAEEEAPIPPYEVEEEVPSGELQHIPYAAVQIVKVLEDGSFEAIVMATEPMEMDTPVTLVVDPSKVPGETREIQNDLSKLLPGVEVSIKNGAYDAGENILYVAEVFFEEEADREPTAAPEKPVIYLYPEEETRVQVKLDFNGTLTSTYPAYESGWDVIAKPDGTLTDPETGREYYCLFWEGISNVSYDMTEGFVVAGRDTEAFLEEKLKILGLTDKEANEFIIYWLPRMEGNAYNLISFQQERYTDNAQLTVEPAPDTVLRVFMTYKPLENMIRILPQKLQTVQRTGFTLVEWGGAEIS